MFCVPEPSVLVIGFGNTLRRDDAVGCLIALEIDSWRRPEIQALAVAQLTPELAGAMAAAKTVVFVDARRDSARLGVQTESVEPLRHAAASLGHVSSPQFLLGLCRVLFGRSPTAWLVSVPAADFELGEGLSEVADRGMRQALETIDAILSRALGEPFSIPPCLPQERGPRFSTNPGPLP
jgi:hydrogenase maturation protease